MPAFLGTTKQRAELAEAVFFERALRLGYVLSKPYGDSAPYDWVVGGAFPRLKRVQVKAAYTLKNKSSYRVSCAVGGHGRTYSVKDIDFLAAYVAPADTWYIIPVSAFSPKWALYFRPHRPGADQAWGKFREAWWRLGRVAKPSERAQPSTRNRMRSSG